MHTVTVYTVVVYMTCTFYNNKFLKNIYCMLYAVCMWILYNIYIKIYINIYYMYYIERSKD
jgi:hypothetical protein